MSTSKPRLQFLDWARGIAAVIMLQGHVFDSFAVGAQRQSAEFILSQWVGGMPPAIFLLLTGVTFAFLMESQERKELGAWDKWLGMWKRARYLLLMAVAFRVQLWLFAYPYSHWTDLLKVDILNCMGVSLLLASPLGLLSRHGRIRWALTAGLAVAVAAPLVSGLPWTGVPDLVRAYLAPNAMAFPIFPWAAFLCFGVGLGTILKMASSRDLGRFAQWAGLAGLILIFASQQLASLPYSLYPKSDFWLDSPWLVLIKLGVALILLSIAYLWTTHVATGWSWVRQLGTSSLLVYWVHTELVYGRWLFGLRGTMGIPQIALLAVTVILAMLGLATVQGQWPRLKAWGQGWFGEPGMVPEPSRAEGD